MKITDQTPFRGADGKISPTDRVKATLKFGASWYDEIMAQDAAVAMFSKHLGKGFYMLQNAILPGSDGVRIPLVLAGPPGVFLINVTNARGMFRAKAEDWGTMDGNAFKPAGVNMIKQSMRLSAALQKYLATQGFEGAFKVEPILLAVNPGAHIDSVRPAIRIVMGDALERFAISLGQAVGTLSPETASMVSERIANPRQPAPKAAPAPVPPDAPTMRDLRVPPAPPPTASLSTPKPRTAPAKPAPQNKKPQPTAKPAAKAAPKKGMDTNKLMLIGGILFIVVVVILIGVIVAALMLNA